MGRAACAQWSTTEANEAVEVMTRAGREALYASIEMTLPGVCSMASASPTPVTRQVTG